MFYLASLPSLVLCIICLASTIALSVCGLYIFKKKFHLGDFAPGEQRAAATICTIVGNLFALLLALIVVNSYQDYKNQNAKVISEAVILSHLYRDTSNYPADIRDSIHAVIKQYTNDVVTDAWPMLAKGKESEKSWNSFNRMYASILKMKASGTQEELIKKGLIDNLNELARLRRERIFEATESSVPFQLWVVLIVGAGLSVLFTYFFKIGTFKHQSVLTVMHATMIGLILYLIISLMYPYTSGIRVKSKPYEVLLHRVFPTIDKQFMQKD